MNSSSLCRDGKLVAGYVAESFPAIYTTNGGMWAGITDEYLRDLAQMLGCERGVEYRKYESAATDCSAVGCGTVLDGALDSGEVLITAEKYYLRANDPRLYSYTVPALAREKLFVLEGRLIGNIEETVSIIDFTVFEPDTLLLIIILFITCHLIERLYQYVFPTTHLRRLPLSVIALSFLALLTFYNAMFSGNATSIKMKPRTTFLELLDLFNTHARQLVIDDISHLNEEEIEVIGLSNIVERPGEQSTIMAAICNNFDLVTFTPGTALTQFTRLKELNTWCTLERIDPPPSNFALVPTLIHSMDDGDDCSFLISKTTDRRALQTANFLLLSVYNWDLASYFSTLLRITTIQLCEKTYEEHPPPGLFYSSSASEAFLNVPSPKDGLHLRRQLPVSQFGFADNIRNFRPPTTFGTKPMTLRRLVDPLVMFGAGIGLSFIGFAVELLFPNCYPFASRSRRLAKWIKIP